MKYASSIFFILLIAGCIAPLSEEPIGGPGAEPSTKLSEPSECLAPLYSGSTLEIRGFRNESDSFVTRLTVGYAEDQMRADGTIAPALRIESNNLFGFATGGYDSNLSVVQHMELTSAAFVDAKFGSEEARLASGAWDNRLRQYVEPDLRAIPVVDFPVIGWIHGLRSATNHSIVMEGGELAWSWDKCALTLVGSIEAQGTWILEASFNGSAFPSRWNYSFQPYDNELPTFSVRFEASALIPGAGKPLRLGNEKMEPLTPPITTREPFTQIDGATDFWFPPWGEHAGALEAHQYAAQLRNIERSGVSGEVVPERLSYWRNEDPLTNLTVDLGASRASWGYHLVPRDGAEGTHPGNRIAVAQYEKNGLFVHRGTAAAKNAFHALPWQAVEEAIARDALLSAWAEVLGTTNPDFMAWEDLRDIDGKAYWHFAHPCTPEEVPATTILIDAETGLLSYGFFEQVYEHPNWFSCSRGAIPPYA